MADNEDVTVHNNDQKIDNEIAYHEEAEHACYRARDYGMAEYHRKMQEILRAMKKYNQENSDGVAGNLKP